MPPYRHVVSLSASGLQNIIQTQGEQTYALIDVRQHSEFMQERLPGAIHLPVNTLKEQLQLLPPDKDYIFYCQIGARSAAAALLAKDINHITGSIYTLEGGLNNWTGFAVAESPRVAVFDEQASPISLLQTALQMEKAAHILYATIRKTAPSTRLCGLMDSLTEIELAHAKTLYIRLNKLLKESGAEKDIQGNTHPFEEYFANLSGEILEGGMTLEELQPWITSAIHGDCLEVADLALEMEMNAYDLYRTLAHNTQQKIQQTTRQGSSEENVALYLDLARQEKQHALLIMRHMNAFEQPDGSSRSTK